ncbi:MAG: sulfotransferase [Pseudomonadota bacterium]
MDLEALKAKAHEYNSQRMFAEAAEAAHLYLQQAPHDLSMLMFLSEVSLFAGYIDEADRIARSVHELAPNGYTWLIMARAASARGEVEEAERLAKEALKVKPDLMPAWQEISAVHKFTPGDPLINKVKRLLHQPDLKPLHQRVLYYLLCKAMNDIGKWDKAWDYAEKGSAIDRPDFDPNDIDIKVAQQRQTFDAEFLAPRPGRGNPTEAPIFVVGMPRSGTTLVEAILAATEKITPMGELTLVPAIIREAKGAFTNAVGQYHNYAWTRTWPDASFKEAADYYLNDVKRRNNGVAPGRFVDKLPGNALHLTEIALMFPRAHIICLERDPLDTCVSCYLGRFGAGHHYSNRPDWLGHVATKLYESMDWSTQILPNPVLKVRYEELVSNPEPQIRRLLDFLGCEWNPNCLTPGREGHTSMTRSKVQIRQPISPRSVGRWKRYKNRIGPLAAALGIPEEEWRARCEEPPKKAA